MLRGLEYPAFCPGDTLLVTLLLHCVVLWQADKLDPREQAKQETREWVNDVVDRLTVRIEQFEYEMEEMQANLKKKAKPPPKLVQVRRA